MNLRGGEGCALALLVAIASLWAHYAVGVNAAHPQNCETKIVVQDNATVTSPVNCRPSDLQILLGISWVMSVFCAFFALTSNMRREW